MIDSIVSLLFCGMGMWTIFFILQSLNNQWQDQTIAYHNFLQTIESSQFNFKLVRVTSQTVTFYSPKTKKEYRLSEYQDMIRLQGTTQGHVPVLEHVKKVEWKSQGKAQLLIRGEFDNGEHFKSVSHFAT